MKLLLTTVALPLMALVTYAQPYVDPFQVRHNQAYDIPKNGEPNNTFTHLYAGCDLPLDLKNGKYLLLSPYYENWKINPTEDQSFAPTVHGLVFPVGLITPLRKDKWGLTAIPMIKTQAEKLFTANSMQVGAVTFLSYEKAEGKKIRFGAYVNTDFFGLFVIPLLGADWRINKRNYIFGLLPGRLTWEHQFNRFLFGGITFRALTSSYRLEDGQYVRFDDNLLSAFMEVYPIKHLCLTIEPGYGIMRKMRTGSEKREYITNTAMGDGLFLKLSVAYRIRF